MRFPGFEGEWKKASLGECSISMDYGMNAAATAFDGQNRYIRITDIDQDSSKYKPESPVSPLGELSDKYLVKKNDILFARTGASTGKTYLYDSDDGTLYFAGFLIRASIGEANNTKFIFAQTQTVSYDRWVKLMSMRSGQPGINSQEYASYQFLLPTKREQDKIAHFLTLIDERIQTQNKIIQRLESLIKGLCKELFTQKLRFKDKNSNTFPDWEKSKLGQVSKNISSGKSKFTSSNIGKHPFYGSTGIIGYSDDFEYSGKKILIARVGANAGSVYKVDGAYSVTDNTLILNLIEIGQIDFIYYFLLNYNLNSLVFGSGQPLITGGQLKKLAITIPVSSEQIRIEGFLCKIYEKVKNEKKALKLYENQKHYLLKSMFM